MRHASPNRAAIVRERARPVAEVGRPLADARGSDWRYSGARLMACWAGSPDPAIFQLLRRLFQNTYFRPNCSSLMVRAEVITPNVGARASVLGRFQLGWLKELKVSSRNCSC